MNQQSALSAETYGEAAEFLRIGSRAVLRAQEESRRLKVPNVYSHNGGLFYELPDGTLTADDPFEQNSNENT